MQIETVPRPLGCVISLFIDEIVLEQQLPMEISRFRANKLSLTHFDSPLAGALPDQALSYKNLSVVAGSSAFPRRATTIDLATFF
jgi:hypothetical protein